VGKTYKNIYQFKIALKHIKPPIWRRIQVPDNYSFWDLHVAIQDAMGWTDSHLHSFHIINPRTAWEEEIGSPGDPFFDDDPIIPSPDKKISKYFSLDNKKALYVYDFGDYWEHEVVLEKILPKEKGAEYPVCIAGKRSCPPEDFGGPYGYMDLLNIVSDPEHEEYDEMIKWLGDEFDPEHFDPDEVIFEDPEERWEYAYGEMEGLVEDDLDEDDFDDTEDVEFAHDAFDKEAKALSRGYVHSLWERAKKDNLEGLSTEEQRLVKILKDHEEEFFNDFEFSDVASDREYDPETDVNPFLYIYIHSVVENQLMDKDPIEVFQFYNAMRNKKCSHHETTHLIGAILTPFMFHCMGTKTSFDIDGYKHSLKQYKTKNPRKLFDQFFSDPESDPDGESPIN
jgi:hypothetical protein